MQVRRRQAGAKHHDLVTLDPVQHPLFVDDQLTQAGIGLTAGHASELAQAAQLARDVGKIFDVFHGFEGEFDGPAQRVPLTNDHSAAAPRDQAGYRTKHET